MLVVSGDSGAGKSSLIRAGVRQLAVHVASLAGIDAASVSQSLCVDPTRFALTAAQTALARPDGSPTSS